MYRYRIFFLQLLLLFVWMGLSVVVVSAETAPQPAPNITPACHTIPPYQDTLLPDGTYLSHQQPRPECAPPAPNVIQQAVQMVRQQTDCLDLSDLKPMLNSFATMRRFEDATLNIPTCSQPTAVSVTHIEARAVTFVWQSVLIAFMILAAASLLLFARRLPH